LGVPATAPDQTIWLIISHLVDLNKLFQYVSIYIGQLKIEGRRPSASWFLRDSSNSGPALPDRMLYPHLVELWPSSMGFNRNTTGSFDSFYLHSAVRVSNPPSDAQHIA
jgi:hypothetical protein